MFLVKFIEVGLGKRKSSWEVKMRETSELALVKSLEGRRAIDKNVDIEIMLDLERNEAFIYAGYRKAGRIEIKEVA